MMKEYTFYEALKEVMENGKEMKRHNILMKRNFEKLMFFDLEFMSKVVDQYVDCVDIKSMWTEYEPPVDWSKVAVDTKIETSSTECGKLWHRRYFSKYENGVVYAFLDGKTSSTSSDDREWQCARLYKE